MPAQLDLLTPIRRGFGDDIRETLWLQVRNVILDFDARNIIVGLYGANEIVRSEEYVGQAAINLLTALQSANFSVKNIQRQILERLIADGRLQGTVSVQP